MQFGQLLLRGRKTRCNRQWTHQTQERQHQMGYVTQDQIERARRIPVLEYLRRYEPNNLKRVGKEYRLHDHPSLSVGEKGFFWHSVGIGSKNALDFLTAVRGYGFVDAVCTLLNECPQTKEIIPKSKPLPERLPLALPLRHKNNRRVLAYLQSRGIDRDLIMDCIERGVLFDTKH